MHFKHLFFLIAFLSVSLGVAQEKKAKKTVSSSFSKQESSAYSLQQKARSLSKKDPKLALDYLEQALSISLKEGDKLGEAHTYAILGEINYNQQLYAQSISFYTKALALYQKEGQAASVLQTRKQLGDAYVSNKNYAQALEQYRWGLKEAEESNNETEAITFKNGMAHVYKLQGKNDEALEAYKDVLTKEKQQRNRSGEREAYENIGDVYLQQNKVEDAKAVYESSQEIALEENDADKLNASYDNIINTYKLEGKTADELELRKKKAEINSKNENEPALAEDYLEIGRLYLQQKQSDKALTYLQKSSSLSRKAGLLNVEAQSQEALSSAYKQKRDFAKALEHYQLYVQAKDSLLRVRERQVNSKLSFTDELLLKQKQIDLLEKDMQLNTKTIQLLHEEKNFSRVVIYALLMGLVIVLVSAWVVYVNAKKRRIANQSLVLRSLRSQMNPHFIFNALNSVNNFISKNDERSANKYLSDFSKLMRTVMENSRYEFISLATELQILQLYLSLEHARFRDKFEYTLTVSEDLSAEQIFLPPMLVQPYIENAIWHGLRYREFKGLLTVSMERAGNELVVTVTDNGIGRKKSAELKTVNQKDKDSIGLKNTEARIGIINELYHTHLRVNISDLDSAEGTGTKVVLFITQNSSIQHEA